MDINKETESKINQLQLLEQNLQTFLMQKQTFQTQLAELTSALGELGKSEESYKIVGSVMVKTKKEELVKDLESKKEIIELRIKTLDKQEEKMKEKATLMQTEVMEEMKNKQ